MYNLGEKNPGTYIIITLPEGFEKDRSKTKCLFLGNSRYDLGVGRSGGDR